jgi:hypothetical protein
MSAALARCALAAIDAAIAGFKDIARHATSPQDSDLSGRLAVPLCSFERSEERRNSKTRGCRLSLRILYLGIFEYEFQGVDEYAHPRAAGE